MKTSVPRTFSPIWKLNSPSENRSVLAFPRSQPISLQISSASGRLAFPEKIFIVPVTLIEFGIQVQKNKAGNQHRLPAYDLQTGWGGRIRTYECRIQRPVPYHLATPQSEFKKLIGSKLKH